MSELMNLEEIKKLRRIERVPVPGQDGKFVCVRALTVKKMVEFGVLNGETLSNASDMTFAFVREALCDENGKRMLPDDHPLEQLEEWDPKLVIAIAEKALELSMPDAPFEDVSKN